MSRGSAALGDDRYQDGARMSSSASGANPQTLLAANATLTLERPVVHSGSDISFSTSTKFVCGG
jgi:hypothetical protein